MNYKENNFEFWDKKYVTQDTGWDLNGPTPVFEKISNAISKGKVCILGCGRGYDAVMFAEKGFKVTAVDFSSEAINSLNKLKNKKQENLTVLQEDIFNLKEDFYEYFDYVIEQTCFCAIHPTRRLDYVHLVKSILKKLSL